MYRIYLVYMPIVCELYIILMGIFSLTLYSLMELSRIIGDIMPKIQYYIIKLPKKRCHKRENKVSVQVKHSLHSNWKLAHRVLVWTPKDGTSDEICERNEFPVWRPFYSIWNFPLFLMVFRVQYKIRVVLMKNQ